MRPAEVIRRASQPGREVFRYRARRLRKKGVSPKEAMGQAYRAAISKWLDDPNHEFLGLVPRRIAWETGMGYRLLKFVEEELRRLKRLGDPRVLSCTECRFRNPETECYGCHRLAHGSCLAELAGQLVCRRCVQQMEESLP